MKPHPGFITRNRCIVFCSTLIFGAGLALMVLRSWLFNFLVSSILVLKPNSMTLDVWREAPLPLILDFYFFNWTNPEEIHDLSKKPKFKQIGPYRFREEKIKVNLTWNNNDTITYRQFHMYHFIEEGSSGNLSDQVTTLNAVTLSAVNQVQNWGYFMKKAFAVSLTAIAPKIHITKPVGQLLFEGYNDPYIDLALTMPFLADTVPPFNKFGWFYTRNNSYTFDGVFNMATGTSGNNLGEILSWNYEKETSFYSGTCSKVHGSAGELHIQRHSRDFISFFSPDMCRNVRLDYERDVLIKNIAGYKYSAQHGMLDNGTILPENECYCNEGCMPSGMLNVSACRYGTPSFVSLPHFYGADPVYLDMVEGLAPEKSKHDTFVTLEPRTGVLLDVAGRLQLNMMLFPVKDVTLYENVPKLIFPLLWFEQKGSIPSDMAFMMRILLNLPIILPLMGSALMVISLVMFIYVTRKLIIKLFSSHGNIKITKVDYDAIPVQCVPKDIFIPMKSKTDCLLADS